MRGLERRVEAGLDPAVASVASIFVSRWDVAVMDTAPAGLRDQLGIAVARRAYRAYRELLDSERWQSLANDGARPQRLLFASTGTKDPEASDVLYVEALAAPFTINTMPEGTLPAFADHGEVGEAACRRRRRRRADPDRVRRGGGRGRSAGRPASGGGQAGLRQVLARAARHDRGAEGVSDLRETEAWQALDRNHAELADRHLRELFESDPARGERLVADGAGLHLDFSKNRIDDRDAAAVRRPRRRARRP